MPEGEPLNPTLAVLTPSFGSDLELFRDLHRSVLEHAPPAVVHHVVVPGRDVAAFAQFGSPRCVVMDERELLPSHFLSTPTRYTINLRRPYPPIRNWILQQIIKLSAASQLEVDGVLLLDSDVALVRPFHVDELLPDGRARLYRKAGAVDSGLPRHVAWHDVARDLLGIERRSTPLADYVSSLMLWQPQVLRQLLTRVQQVAQRPWPDAIGARLHFSEWTLYGVYVDEFTVLPPSAVTDDDRCHNYWGSSPLTTAAALDFVSAIPGTALAMMISAKSRTPLEVRRMALSAADRSVRLEGPSSDA
jgi:hypothetical protein